MTVSQKWTGGSMVRPKFLWAPSDVRYFHVEGHLVVEGFLTPEALSFLRERFDAVFEAKHPEVHSEWVMSLHQILPRGNWLWHLASEPKLLDLIEQLLGPDLVLYSTQLTDKPPGGGREVPWHQDGERCLTLWIPLDDIGPENGGLIVKPRYHVHGRLRYKHVQTEAEYEDALFNMQHSVFAVDSGIPEKEFNQNVLEYRLPAGALSMHHPSLPHCSHPNTTTDRHRRVIIMRYQPATEPIVQNPLRHYLTGEEFIKCNYIMRGHMGDCRAGNSRASCQLERPLTLRYDLRQSPRRTRNSQPEGARPWKTRP